MKWMSNTVHFGVQVVLDSDDKLFGGFGRIDPDATYLTNVRTSS